MGKFDERSEDIDVDVSERDSRGRPKVTLELARSADDRTGKALRYDDENDNIHLRRESGYIPISPENIENINLFGGVDDETRRIKRDFEAKGL